MSQHVTLSPGEAADRHAIQELVEAYAHCADRRMRRPDGALHGGNPICRRLAIRTVG